MELADTFCERITCKAILYNVQAWTWRLRTVGPKGRYPLAQPSGLRAQHIFITGLKGRDKFGENSGPSPFCYHPCPSTKSVV